jgi:hypothetical protein
MTIVPHRPLAYLAGKIGANDWRQAIVDLRNRVSPDDALDPKFELACGRFIITGPFFVACDHGCYHGPHTHGAGVGCTDDWNEPVDARRHRILALSEQRIDRAGFVFAYIDAADCYGTLVELGYAHAL